MAVRKKKLSSKVKTVIWVAIIGAVSSLMVAVVNNLKHLRSMKHRSESPQNTHQTQNKNSITVNNSPGASVNTGSYISNSFNTFTSPVFEFREPGQDVMSQVLNNLSQFRRWHTNPLPIVVQAESGDLPRRQVAALLGTLLATNRLGYFWAGTSIGYATEAPIIIKYNPGEEEAAKKFRDALSPYISGQTHIDQTHRVMSSHSMTLHLLGRPEFSTNGTVTFR